MRIPASVLLALLTLLLSASARADKSLIAHYPLDEGKGDVARDKSSSGYNAEITSPTWTESERGGALDFGKANAKVDCGPGKRLGLKKQLTISLWCVPKRAAAPKKEIILAGEGVKQWGLTYYGEKAYFYISDGGNYCTAPAAPGEWHHLAGTYDGATMRFYRNGDLVVERILPPDTAIATAQNFVIGAGPKAGWHFPGLISDVRVYNRALSQEDIRALAKTAPPKELTAAERRIVQSTTKFFSGHAAPPSLETEGNRIRFANALVGLEFTQSADTCRLSRLCGIAGNQEFLPLRFGASHRNLWQIKVRTDNGRDPDERILGVVDAGAFSHRVLSGDSWSTLHLEWDRIDLPDEKDAMTVRVSVTLKNGDPLSYWRIRVRNRSAKWGVWQVHFPVLKLIPVGKDIKENVFTYPKDRGRVVENCFEAPSGYGHGLDANEEPPTGPGQPMPGSMGMQFQSLYNAEDRVGLYLATQDPDSHYKHLRVVNNRTDLLYLIAHDPPNMGWPDEDYAMPYDFVMGPFAGDWYDACQIYRAWALNQTWCGKGPLHQRNDIPKWLKEAPIMLRCDTIGNEKFLPSNRDAFLQFLDLAQVPLPSVWYGWKDYRTELTAYDLPTSPWRFSDERPYPCGNTHDGNYPKIPALPGFGEACKTIRDGGGYPAPYVCLQIYDQGPTENAPYVAEARPWVVRDVNGKSLAFGREPSWFMCTSTDWWRERLIETCVKLVRREHVGGLYLDTMHGAGGPCFAVEHGHSHGGGSFRARGMHELSRAIRNAVKGIDPDVITSGEDSSENMIDVIDAKLYQYTLHPASKYPLFATVYQDYIPRYGIRSDNNPGDEFFVQAGSLFVEGAIIGRVRIGGDRGPAWKKPEHAEHLAFLKRIIGYYRQDVAKKFLSYGRLLRPLTFKGPDPMPVVGYTHKKLKSFREGRVELPALQQGVFRSQDNELGIFIVNISAEAIEFNAPIDLADYGLPGGKPYDVEVISPDQGIQAAARPALRRKGTLSGKLPAHHITMFRIKPGP